MLSLDPRRILIDPPGLQLILDQPSTLVVDASVELAAPRFDGDYQVASGRQAWLQDHIPGARHADLLEALADPSADFSFALPDPRSLEHALGALGVGRAENIVLYDRHDGFWAARLWWMLRSLGIAARVLDGGFKAWRRAGLAECSGEEAGGENPTELTLTPLPGYWASHETVQAVAAGEAPGTLVCALSAALFEGRAVTRYARRGHIPGSLNRPARALFDAQGRYLPPAALAQALGADLLNGTQPLILYCGGGISAAATALALTLLGREQVAIYDGSLQQWAADHALPMTTGAAPA